MKIKAFLVCLFFLAGCTSHSQKKDKPKNILRLNIVQDPATLDPRKSSDFVTSTLHFLLYEGVTKMTPYSLVCPAIADEIEVSDDGLEYKFHLRDAKWSNGNEITSYDFVKSWTDMLDPQFPCPNSHLLYCIYNAQAAKSGTVPLKEVGLHIIDHKTFCVILEHPTPHLPETLSFCTFFPVSQIDAVTNPEWSEGKNGHSPISSGPFILTKWSRGKEIVLEKNPYYYDADHVDLDEIHLSIIDNETTCLHLFEQGELDILGVPYTGIPTDALESLRGQGRIQTACLPASSICTFNLGAFPFTNKHIRKAFAGAINRAEIVKNLAILGEAGYTFLPPSLMLEQEYEPLFLEKNPQIAKSNLQKGLLELHLSTSDLQDIVLIHPTTGIYPRLAQVIQDQWKKNLGVEIRLQPYEFKVFLDKLTHHNYDMALCVLIAQYHDPMSFFERFESVQNPKNYPGYCNKTYRKLLSLSHRCKDSKERLTKLHEALAVFREDMPLCPIYHCHNPYLVQKHVKNLQLHRGGSFHLLNVRTEKKK